MAWALASRAEEILFAKATHRHLDLHAPELVTFVPATNSSEELSLPEGLELGALFELETAHSDGSTETTMATVELGAGWQATDWVHGDIVFLYEEDATDPMELNQLYITLGDAERVPLSLQVGRFYAPFGNLDSLFVSDPVVLELSESLEEGGTLRFEKAGFVASLTVFDSKIAGADDYNAIFSASYDTGSIAFGASLIRNILDADGLSGVLEDEGDTFAEEVAGFNAWLTATKGKATFIAEVVQALDSIEVDDSDMGLQPASLNLEVGYAMTDRIQIGGKYEYADDVADWFAEQRYGAVCNWTVVEHDLCTAGISLEYLREKYEADEADLFTLQLILEL